MNKDFIAFLKFLIDFQKVERRIHVPGSEKWENDAEHSYQMALLAWYLINTNNYDLDLEKVILLCLAHDLVEAYAGDSFFYDDKARETKKEREAQALKKIRKEYNSFTQLHQIIVEYEKGSSKEAKFVRAVDKLIPVLNIYIDGGRSWKEAGVSLENILSKKDAPLMASPELAHIWEDLKKILATNQKSLFG